MDLVVDANILFSVLIRSGKTEELMFEPELHLFAPEFIFEEFAKYKQFLIEKTSRTEQEFEEVLYAIRKRVTVVPNEETETYMRLAEQCCPDIFDRDYFALAVKLHCPIWSNDKELKIQDKIQIYTTKELMNILE